MAAADGRAAGGGELARRVRVGVAAAAAALVGLALGGYALWLLAVAAAVAGFAEWIAMVGGDRGRAAFGWIALGLGLAFAAPGLWGPDRSTVALLLIAALVTTLVPRAAAAAGGAAYLGTAAIALLFLRGQPHGFLLALWTVTIVWATDIGAYFAGRRFGGPLLAPRISPKKTWSGLAGGMVAATLVGLAIGAAGGLPGWTLWLAPLLAVVAQGGDLFESALKRRAGIKDSGRLLPGHGGVLDRIDGLLPVLVVVAALVANGGM